MFESDITLAVENQTTAFISLPKENGNNSFNVGFVLFVASVCGMQ
jgi:hypothetical protein